SSNHWIGLRAVGTKSNRDGIGARLMVKAAARTFVDEVRSGSSYNSNHDMRIHFGLGSVAKVDYVDLRWPSGLVERFSDVSVAKITTVKEGEGKQLDGGTQKAAKER